MFNLEERTSTHENLSLAHSLFSEIGLRSLDPMVSSEGKLGMQKLPQWVSPLTAPPTTLTWRERRKPLVFHPNTLVS